MKHALKHVPHNARKNLAYLDSRVGMKDLILMSNLYSPDNSYVLNLLNNVQACTRLIFSAILTFSSLEVYTTEQ
jgi:hypothetical protein